jgi:hypothetical protein
MTGRKNGMNIKRNIACRAARVFLALTLVFGAILTGPAFQARASVGPPIPVPQDFYNSGPYGGASASGALGNHNGPDYLPYFGDGYTSFDDPFNLIWLDWVIYLHWLPPHMNMAQQLSNTMAYQVLMVGALFDAKNEQETQRLMQQLAAEAHRDYQPDMLLCEFGTNVRSLASSEALARENTRYIDLTLLKRDKLSRDLSVAGGIDTDLSNRFEKFRRIYCNVNDDNTYLTSVCAAGIPARRINNDIDYTKLIENRYTLTADFSQGPGATAPIREDQEDIIAFLNNIFTFRPFSTLVPELLQEEFAKNTYMDMRSANAIRSVAHNSFAHIIGMRTNGPPIANSSQRFMRRVLDQLQVPVAEIDQFLGPQPSYYAQMEVLTHKIFESPEFFTNLYTTPANVDRIGVTLQALTLMQNRDRYESALRREMLLSLILELGIRERQYRVLSDVQKGANTLIGQPQ